MDTILVDSLKEVVGKREGPNTFYCKHCNENPLPHSVEWEKLHTHWRDFHTREIISFRCKTCKQLWQQKEGYYNVSKGVNQ